MRSFLFFLLLAAIVLLSNTTIAQRNCASHEYLLQQLADHPEMLQARERLEDFTRQFVKDYDAMKFKTTNAAYTIPVVVHVLYKTASQNISDAQINSQIAILNADFQKLNADAANTPQLFSSLVADCQIQFCLAQQDPNGNPTNGIIRKATTKTFYNYNTDNAKFSSQGGDDAWPRDQYLNIWVVPGLLNNVIGYAQFPGGPASTDGVVVVHNCFGNTGTASAPFDKGRTATHEVGHWINLRHIWGDDNGACSGSDFVDDTPNQGNYNFGCPGNISSCNNNGDMHMNYMDYTDDACMYMFTNGQKARMHAVFAPNAPGSRYAITSSPGCQPPSGGTICNAPTTLNANPSTTSAALSWNAPANAVSYNLEWKASSSGSWTAVNNISGTSYNLTGLTANTSYDFHVRTNCSGSQSAFSNPQSFTTQSVSSGCSDNYEPNNSISSATAIATNSSVSSMIGSLGDDDYYVFSTSGSSSNIKITLSNLPADYDLKLYKSNGKGLLGSSNSAGMADEEIVYNTNKGGTYYVQVYGFNGAFNNGQCYDLLVETNSSNFREGENAMEELSDNTVTFYPNPAKNELFFECYSATSQDGTLHIIDQSGRLSHSIPVQLEEGNNQTKINISNISSGFYFVRFVTAQKTYSSKLMIER